ncbi:hypothetical protein [Idiomarina sp.]|uniref:hypothetical protein n=1 Tax=Idiomarina sp. TaxID=1874361 RepID=UPI003A92A4A4
MKNRIWIAKNSLVLSGGFSKVQKLLDEASRIKNQTKSELNSYSQSNDIGQLIEKLYEPDNGFNENEKGVITSIIYGPVLSGVEKSEISTNEILNLIEEDDKDKQVSKDFLFSIDKSIGKYKNIVFNEDDIFQSSIETLKNFNHSVENFPSYIESIFKNLYFCPEYNSLSKLDSDFNEYKKAIIDFLLCLNNFENIDVDTKRILREIKAGVPYDVVEEGGGKEKRRNNSTSDRLKRLVVINKERKNINCEYHYKLSYKDSDNQRKKYTNANRIYFGILGYKENKFAIAHIGNHL